MVLVPLAGFPFPLFVIAGACLALAIWVARWYNSKQQVIKRTLQETPVTEMKDVQEGTYVRIRGEIRAVREVIKAPLTGRRCVYYSVTVRKRVAEIGGGVSLLTSTGGLNVHWATIVEDEVMADVVITDGKHYAILECDQPRAYLVADGNFRTGFLNEVPEVLENYLKKYGESSRNILGANMTTEYSEGILEEGEFCTVKGHGYWVDAKKLKLKLPVDKVLVIREKPDQPLYLSDHPDLEQLGE